MENHFFMEWLMKQKQSEIKRKARTAWMWSQERPYTGNGLTIEGQLSEKAFAVLADFLENGNDQMRLQAADIVLRHLSRKETDRKRLLKRVFSK